MEPLKRLVAINDLSGVGKCSLTVTLPVVSATGVECACLPTTVLSTHTCGFTGYTVRDLSQDILPIAEHWKREGLHFDAICTGYMANPAQADGIEKAVELIRSEDTFFVVDPAMADNGAYYPMLGEPIRDAFRRLIAKADVITPNVTEAALLTGLPYHEAPHSEEYIQELLHALGKLGAKIVAITSVFTEDGLVGNVALDTRTGEVFRSMHLALEGSFHGAGDVFTASLSSLLVRGATLREAMQLSAMLVCDSIERTVRRGTPRHMGVDFESALPDYGKRVAQLLE